MGNFKYLTSIWICLKVSTCKDDQSNNLTCYTCSLHKGIHFVHFLPNYPVSFVLMGIERIRTFLKFVMNLFEVLNLQQWSNLHEGDSNGVSFTQVEILVIFSNLSFWLESSGFICVMGIKIAQLIITIG